VITNRLTAAVSAALLVSPAALPAYDFSIGPLESAPVAISPASGTFAYQYGAPNLSFVWEQYPAVASQTETLPTHFLLCLRAAQETCTHASAAANVLPGQLSSVLLWRNQQPVGYRYTFTPTLPDSKLDASVEWSVLGCWGGADSSCHASASKEIVASTSELQAVNLSSYVIGDNYKLTAEGRNRGSRDSRPFDATMMAWKEVMFDPATELCVTNPNEPLLPPSDTLWLLDDKGAVTQLSKVPRDATEHYIKLPQVVAILRAADPYGELSSDVHGVVLTPSTTARDFIDNLKVSVPVDERPRAVASAMYLDTGGQVYETDESNNAHVQCEVVHANQ
jgi:hypothetical protein